jgi:methylated-DNA-[protein]-cysteine S-methyltransferase
MSQENRAFQAVINVPFGQVGITLQGERLVGVDYLEAETAPYIENTPGVRRVLQSIDSYLADPTHRFELETDLAGTDFQKRVWQALQAIPAGKALTYGELAEKIGTGARAVGNACRANPCPLIVPCHRVVAANGLGGFAGQRSGRKLEIKRWLLQHEGRL